MKVMTAKHGSDPKSEQQFRTPPAVLKSVGWRASDLQPPSLQAL